MTYTLAFYDDYSITHKIEIRSNLTLNRVIACLRDLSNNPDLQAGITIEEACTLIGNDIYSGALDGLSLTVVDSNDTVICSF